MSDTPVPSYSHLNGVLPSNANVRRIRVGLDEYLVPPPIRDAAGTGYLLYLSTAEGFSRFTDMSAAQEARVIRT